MSKPEVNKMTSSANLAAASLAAIETASSAGLSKADVEAALAFVASVLED